MKVILLKDVAKIGRRNEVVNVPDGYAMNQLIPKNMAAPATPTNLKKIEKLEAQAAASVEADNERFSSAKKALSEKVIKIEVDSNDQGHLFKAVNEADISAAAKGVGVDIESAMVVIKTPIKELGEHELSLKLGGNTASFTIEVIKKG